MNVGGVLVGVGIVIAGVVTIIFRRQFTSLVWWSHERQPWMRWMMKIGGKRGYELSIISTGIAWILAGLWVIWLFIGGPRC